MRDPGVGVGAGLKDVGARRKSRDQDFVDGEAAVGEPRERSWTMRLAGRGRVLGVGGRREGGMVVKATEGSVRSSRISLIVNAAWVWVFARVSSDVAGAFVGGGRSHLHRSSSADNPYALDPASGEGVERVLGHVRLAQYVDVC